jgi:predicted TIM-barrel fold metal-dependent hydrolase
MKNFDLEIVDTHVHFFDLTHKVLKWSWLMPDSAHGLIGNIDGMKSLRYEAEHIWAEARFANVKKFVHIQAAIGSEDPVDETIWLTKMSDRMKIPHAIIAHTDLALDTAKRTIDRHLESVLLRGVRDFSVEPTIKNAVINKNLEESLDYLAKNNLVLDLDCEWPNMQAAADMARRHPDLGIIIEHIGFPHTRTDEYFTNWKSGMKSLAGAENVHCKVSGLGMTDPNFTYKSLEPWIDQCLELFTPKRIMFGSNWPLDRLFSSYDAIIGIYRASISQYSLSEQKDMTSLNAERFYRI